MITISSKGIYGLIALVELGNNYNKKKLQIKDIAKEKNIPRHYLEQILLVLKRNGIVKSYRGINGGYSLAKSPDKIMLNDILDCLESELKLNRIDIDSSFFKHFWDDKTNQLRKIFHLSLKKIIDDKKKYSENYIYNI